ncbi:MAG TPA: fibrobacter succinogenes major paralogous domain-containing protein [Bacteroidales bacterium]|nr:fibrobacter succinogenes major paralogous domain-containing protein [Bacteroidales bacterium]
MKFNSFFILLLIAISTQCYSQTTESPYYSSVIIGSQQWMTKNLDISKFRNGDIILEAKNPTEWIKYYTEGKPAWCYYNYDKKYNEKYGKLYNWFAVNDSRGLAPEGWRVSTYEDWKVLTDFAGGEDIASPKLRTTIGWENDGNGSNEYGFNGLPGGSVGAYGMFGDIGNWGSWWCYNPNSNPVYGKYLKYDSDRVEDYASYLKTDGLSVRCLRDTIEE